LTREAWPPRHRRLTVPLGPEGDTLLSAERLRDGRVAVGTRRRVGGDEWQPGDLLVLDRPAFLALAGWLDEAVEDAWIDAVRERQAEPLRTARERIGIVGEGQIIDVETEITQLLDEFQVVRVFFPLRLEPHNSLFRITE
jgi:hypothetical protein